MTRSMRFTDKPTFDTATILTQGRRGHQEDSLALDFPEGAEVGFVVLGDGMGGHTSGEIASKLVVAEVFRTLKRQSADPDLFESRIGEIFREATENANVSVGEYTRSRPETRGMGTTLLSPVIVRDKLFWISIGDSPLYIFRGNTLVRLNQNHTLHGQYDYLVENDLLDPNRASIDHDDCLTSAIIGSQIAQIDCSDAPVALHDEDILIAASDGLQYLTDEEISDVLLQFQQEPAAVIGDALLSQVNALDDPDQDNVACCIVKVGLNSEVPLASSPAPKNDSFAKTVESTTILVATLQKAKHKTQCRVSMRRHH